MAGAIATVAPSKLALKAGMEPVVLIVCVIVIGSDGHHLIVKKARLYL
jgi:hypothetical protein